MKRLPAWLLIVLLTGVFVWLGWRWLGRQSAPIPVAAQTVKPAPFVDLGGPNDRKTIDFSSGKPVVKDTPEEKAALEKAVREMDEAVKGVTFAAPKKPAEPPPATPKN